jgi:UrcA family protein
MKSTALTNYIGTGMLAFCATVGQAWMVNAAHAADAASTQSLRISARDLDLSKSEDVAKLYQRIKSAANKACGNDVVTGSRLESQNMKECVAQAVNGTVEQMNIPTLSSYHKQETNHAGA